MFKSYDEKKIQVLQWMVNSTVHNYQYPYTRSNFIKKETLAQMFSHEFCEISKNTITTEHLQMTDDYSTRWLDNVIIVNSRS